MREKLRLWFGSHDAQYIGLLAIVGCVLMAFCSYTSPAFYFDYSPDNNAFFTVGKAMMHGIVPYRDIFEQKGPYVYFLHGLAYLVAQRSFIFIFVMEIIALVAAMTLTYYLARRLRLTELGSFVAALLSPVLFLYHPYYDYGDTVEFFVVPLLLSLVYLIVLLDQRGMRVNRWWFFSQGLFVGVVFLSKYTLLGAWIAFYLVLGIYLAVKRNWLILRRVILTSGAGFLVAVLPWLIYFLMNHALTAFFRVYIVFNTHAYVASTVSAFSKLIQSAILLAQFYLGDVLFFVLGLVGTLIILYRTDILQRRFTKALYLVTFLLGDLFAVYGYQTNTVYQYYQLAYFPFFVVPFVYFLGRLFRRANLRTYDDAFVILGTIILSLFLVLGVNDNVEESRLFPNNASVTLSHTRKPQRPAQTIFGQLMRSKTPADQPMTLLNYGSIDMGFYTSSGAVPSEYYFQNYNVPQSAAPQILRDQKRAIAQKRVEWVVLNTPSGRSVRGWRAHNHGRIGNGNLNPGTAGIAKSLYHNYRRVAKHSQRFENTNVTYWLFQRK
ncbi:MAG TPA: glycosyltransferase family 39 protein [Candidatus Levilactobacillus faecigallinarum]|uniref:Glycosyltransferase family 39 protein n=1 Tax=Candidatus Levilactobacillus faecigallinarum TaxID=2838638 RepID=A0A9D1QRY8_9LACO|nr:glycosyltransferase family 39 protein [Candidatus Levilactobacillus faecigallinarum]